ncbi:MAG: AAA family ATPase [Sandaracinaceae bacterium]|nr:AAA family ATPase [Sandaracinaceae bacterium]
MRILQLEIENFRAVRHGKVMFPEHALLVGPNNVGKSTVLEALNLVLGPDGLSGPSSIDEHDFHVGRYRLPKAAGPEPKEPHEGEGGAEGTAVELRESGEGAPRISITVVLSGLSKDELTRFRAHVEAWNAAEGRVYRHDEAESLTPTARDYVLRVGFRGWYSSEDDEFQAETVFLSPEAEGGELEAFGRRHKQAIGFLYLRALRTARRAATLQRGSLLDILLHLEESEPRIWQDMLDGLIGLGEATSKEPGLRAVLDELERAMGAYVPGRKADMPPSCLNVTQLTREQLRTVMTYFLTDAESGHLLPHDRLGSGIANLLVLGLLTLIAKRKSNVIFAMEEPEIALGPTVQRRIIAKLKEISTQALVTSHSPYVAEQMLPDNILVLRRNAGVLESHVAAAAPELKEKFLRQHFRQRFAEGLVGNAVLVVEGETELYAMPAASEVLAAVPETAYRSLDVLGVVPVLAEGDGNLAKVASFFAKAGIDTYVFCDTLNDASMLAGVRAAAHDAHEHPYKNFEDLLSVSCRLPWSSAHSGLWPSAPTIATSLPCRARAMTSKHGVRPSGRRSTSARTTATPRWCSATANPASSPCRCASTSAGCTRW